jgi:ribonucleoside-diphosphate reductase alpha chain
MPSARTPSFDFAAFGRVIDTSVRMLDNVLDATHWPLEQQLKEAQNKRRVGLGFTGLGDALIMLKLRYDTDAARAMATKISEYMRDRSYLYSVELAKERGAFPLFNADMYLSGGNFASRLPQDIKDQIRKHGLRNSHLLSIAPTGTISLAFADNASNGIEPPFSWTYTRKKRMADGTFKEYAVEDYAWRLYKHQGGDVSKLPDYFVTALEISAQAHEQMVAAVAPYVDTSISKTVNVPADYPYSEFEDLYMVAWKSGLKGLATYRPNSVLGSVLSVTPTPRKPRRSSRRTSPSTTPTAACRSAPCPPRCWQAALARPAAHGRRQHRLDLHDRGPARRVRPLRRPDRERNGPRRALRSLGQWRRAAARHRRRGQDPVDGHARQRQGLAQAQARRPGQDPDDDSFELPLPPNGERKLVPGVVSALAQVVRYRCEKLGALEGTEATPVIDCMFSRDEPKTGTDGTLSWTVDVVNPAAGEEFVLGLKEITLPDGVTRPYSVWLSGHYPRALDGLTRLLSLDMRVLDPAWIGMKLRKLLNYAEPLGDFMARVPGSSKQQNWPSTVAYIARLIMHRYAMLGILDENGYPTREMGILEVPEQKSGGVKVMQGSLCSECGNYTVIRKDGCDFCSACGAVGSCG